MWTIKGDFQEITRRKIAAPRVIQWKTFCDIFSMIYILKHDEESSPVVI